MARYTSLQVYFANGGEQLTLSLLFVLMTTMKDGTFSNSKKLDLNAGDLCEMPNYSKFVGMDVIPATFVHMKVTNYISRFGSVSRIAYESKHCYGAECIATTPEYFYSKDGISEAEFFSTPYLDMGSTNSEAQDQCSEIIVPKVQSADATIFSYANECATRQSMATPTNAQRKSADLRRDAVCGSAVSENHHNFFLMSELTIILGDNTNQIMTRKQPSTISTVVEVNAWELNIMHGERRGIQIIQHNTNTSYTTMSAENPTIKPTVVNVQPSGESSLYVPVIHFEIMTASNDKGSHIYGLGSVCTFPNRQSLQMAPASKNTITLVNNDLNLTMGEPFKDHEKFIVFQAQQSSDKENNQPDRNNRNDRYQDIMMSMSLEQYGRVRKEPDNQSSGKDTAKTAAAAYTFRRGVSTSYQDGCNSKPQYLYFAQVQVLPDSADTSGQENEGLFESGLEPTFSRPCGDDIPVADLYETTAIPSGYGWYVRRYCGGMRTTPSRKPDYNDIEFVIHDEGTTDEDSQPIHPTPGMDCDPSTTLESSSVLCFKEPVDEDTSRVTDAAPRDSPEQCVHLALVEDIDKLVLFVAIFPGTTNIIATIRISLPDPDDNNAIDFRYADASHEDLDHPKRWKDPDNTCAQNSENEELEDESCRSDHDEFGGAPLRNPIEDRRRIAAMELCIVRKSHELPRQDNSSNKMTSEASTLMSEGLVRLFTPEPTTDPTLHHGVPVLSTQQPKAKYL